MPSIVRIYAQTAEPNLALPWQRERPFESSGTGFAIALANGTMRVLTNAHVVEHASVLQVRRRGDDRKYEARVVALGAECDLALLQVDDDDAFVEAEEPVSSAATTARPNFWDWPKLARRPRGAFWRGAPPLEWGRCRVCRTRSPSSASRLGAKAVSVTAGVVSESSSRTMRSRPAVGSHASDRRGDQFGQQRRSWSLTSSSRSSASRFSPSATMMSRTLGTLSGDDRAPLPGGRVAPRPLRWVSRARGQVAASRGAAVARASWVGACGRREAADQKKIANHRGYRRADSCC